MFTGIIEEVGVVSRRSGPDVSIMAKDVLEDAKIGDSIAINGACMTIVALNDDNFVVQVSPESMKRTTLGELRPGHAVNLERAMLPTTRFGGHFVSGHVDGVGKVSSVEDEGEFSFWIFQGPPEVSRYLVPKGSVTVDGISLTVVEPAGDTFGVAIIPSTLEKTTLKVRKAGDLVNLEADLIGKHIYHYLRGDAASGISREMLARHGFA